MCLVDSQMSASPDSEEPTGPCPPTPKLPIVALPSPIGLVSDPQVFESSQVTAPPDPSKIATASIPPVTVSVNHPFGNPQKSQSISPGSSCASSGNDIEKVYFLPPGSARTTSPILHLDTLTSATYSSVSGAADASRHGYHKTGNESKTGDMASALFGGRVEKARILKDATDDTPGNISLELHPTPNSPSHGKDIGPNPGGQLQGATLLTFQNDREPDSGESLPPLDLTSWLSWISPSQYGLWSTVRKMLIQK